MVGSKITNKVFAIYQPKEMSIPSEKSLVSWLCGVLERHLYGR